MSRINIGRAVQNIVGKTEPYSALVELAVNAVESIEEAGHRDGCVTIRVLRSDQISIDQALPDVVGFEVEDNGIGFNREHLQSFDTLYTDLKIQRGGKGFGRFVCLKHFKKFSVHSVYESEHQFFFQKFHMGEDHDIIHNPEHGPSEIKKTGTTVTIRHLRSGSFPDKKLDTIAKVLLQRILPFFLSHQERFPKIILCEDSSVTQGHHQSICLNDFLDNQIGNFLERLEPDNSTFSLTTNTGDQKHYDFSVYIYKLYTPRNWTNRISLVAHKREVLRTQLSDHIPEFQDAFDEDSGQGELRKYIIKAYVCSDYLDENVSVERGGFRFKKHPDIENPIGRLQIEEKVSQIVKSALGSDITTREDQNIKTFQDYVDHQAPWHKRTFANADLSKLPYRPTEEQMEVHLRNVGFQRELDLKTRVKKMMSDVDFNSTDHDLTDIVNDISDSSKEKLAEYVVFRKIILDLFKKNLGLTDNGHYSYERVLHDIIFRRKGDTDSISYEDHNLWLIDERLNFTSYVASDKPLGAGNQLSPDILAFNRAHMFRGDNVKSNPITIFEFKRPQEDAFANPSSREDPVTKIVRYVNDIRAGKFKTPDGRPIEVTNHTPAYGFVVCDITPKVQEWLRYIKDFRDLPDNLGWYRWYDNNSLLIQVIKWEKILQDAEIRNKIYFKKLGLA
ncbi:MAG: ATP-binding protein [Bacteroidetes bacterium]|nr:ATP-binding protein [Bacteroidota bacterium]MCY4233901.1 ATP-binding protein [Bacteroidota bacterium]